MFCTSCGAQAHDSDLFCPGCGQKLKHAAAGAASGGAAYAAGDPFAPTTSYVTIEKPRRKNKGAGVIAALLIVVVLAMLVFAGSRGYLGDKLTGLSCAGCSAEDILPVGGSADPADDGADVQEIPAVSGSDASEETTTTTAEAATTTTTTATTTTTTTKPTTTTTTENAKKKEAEEIRKLLVAKTWTTEIEGYKATIKFKSDGTATITVKVLFMSKTIDAQYSVNDQCHAVILGEYNGSAYGISGTISKSSDTKLVVERDKNMGTVTLTEA